MKASLILGAVALMTLAGCGSSQNGGQPTANNGADSQAQQASAQVAPSGGDTISRRYDNKSH